MDHPWWLIYEVYVVQARYYLKLFLHREAMHDDTAQLWVYLTTTTTRYNIYTRSYIYKQKINTIIYATSFTSTNRKATMG